MGGKRNRTAGFNFEREIVKQLKAIGFKDAATSRYASREMDDKKVDIVNCDPISPQAKRTKNYPNFYKLLKSMPTGGNYNIVIHKRKYEKAIAVLTFEDLLQLLEIMKTEKII